REHPWYREANSMLLTAAYSGIRGLLFLFSTILSRVFQKLGVTFRNPYQQYDLIVDLSTDALNDFYLGVFAPLFVLLNILQGIIAGKPVMVCATSIGPFKNRLLRFLTRWVLNKVDVITVREEMSRDYLRALHINKPKIQVTADLAFLLKPVSGERLRRILKDENIVQSDKPLIGIATTHKFIFTKPEQYIRLMAQITDTLVNDLKATVIFIPHDAAYFDDRHISNDRIVFLELYQEVENKHGVRLVLSQPMADELKGIIGMCDLIISSKFHPLVAATSMAVPSIALVAYGQYKFYGIISQMMAQEKCIVDITNPDYDSLLAETKSKIDYAWSAKDSIKKELVDKARIATERALFNGRLIKELIGSRRH
ncbi:polysaccharide pyruvyl transferase family protein, partial [Dehalococcoidales bacterium]|nr:polysaccharide pyruvyl transferase family protein [Dehalococcoidales bacterium]